MDILEYLISYHNVLVVRASQKQREGLSTFFGGSFVCSPLVILFILKE